MRAAVQVVVIPRDAPTTRVQWRLACTGVGGCHDAATRRRPQAFVRPGFVSGSSLDDQTGSRRHGYFCMGRAKSTFHRRRSMANKQTGTKAATKASKTLSSGATSKTSKSAAGSALTQTKAPRETTSPKAATAASKTLRNKSTSANSKSAAASALSQKEGSRSRKK